MISRLSFGATPAELAEMARKVDKKGGMTGSDFAMKINDEKAEDLRKAAEIIKKGKNPDPNAIKLLTDAAKILDEWA